MNMSRLDLLDFGDGKKIKKNSGYNERDLHILLSSYVYASPEFHCVTKTIYHEKTSKTKKDITNGCTQILLEFIFRLMII